MKTFKDLDHQKTDTFRAGTHAVMFFNNGYGVSVLCHKYSYGGDDGLYELAVLKGTDEENDICYDTDITSDVLGYLTPNDVTEAMQQIQKINGVTA
mgnify:CR=1 FL=1